MQNYRYLYITMKYFRILLLLFCGVFIAVTVMPQSVEDRYEKSEYRIAMRDTVELYTAVYAPRGGEKAPIIIFRTPYSCKPYGVDKFLPELSNTYLGSYVDRGYIIVYQDVRGRYMSGGEFENIRPAGFGDTDETTDSYDTVDWLVKNIPNNNGRVGFAGCSYPGFYALMGGLSGHPAVKAISPQAPVTDWFMGDDVFHNGVMMLADATRFLSSMSSPGPHTPTEQMPGRRLPTTPDEGTFFLKNGTRSEILKLLEPNAFWTAMSAHSDYDDWWQARNTRNACYNIRPAVLVVGGTYDAEDCFGAWSLYRAICKQSSSTVCKLVIGPWAHGSWNRSGRTLGDFDFGKQASGAYYVEHFEAPFFDHYLKGNSEAPDSLPAASVFTSGDNKWHSFDRWTPRRAKPETFYLTEGGRLETAKPTAKSSSTSYVSDPSNPVPYIAEFAATRPKEYMVADQRFLSGRADVLTFVTEPLAEDMTLVGPVEPSLEVALSTADADFVVKLIDVFPDGGEKSGCQMLVRGDVMRGRYRNSFSKPEPFTPGVPATVRFRMTDVAHTFRAGHRVMVQVQSTWFPLAERNPQQYVDLWSFSSADFVPCRVTLLHQRSNASTITVQRLQ